MNLTPLFVSGTPLFGPVPGGMEMLVILLVAVLLFGANKLPKLARASGQAMGEFKKGREDIEREIRESAEAVKRDDEFEDEVAEI